ncbi:RHS repeat-associated core domain-containing protein [Roseimaritima sediminicola]|uniref:RHS repeat-associated core domain-containing protein n=1 Tax=Roseimaritima sediminicola TaxID=2662066 RepID=UPI0012982662|nr:RHS repeat-associated core domain-containing protein [Roseimaritima sediminicola]
MSNYGFTVPTSGYDDEDRLVGWNRADSNLDQSWNLSLVGDWDSFTENSTTQNRTHGDAHEILTADSQAVTHDAKGNQTGLPSNLTTSTSGLTLEWDFENKLHAADVDGTSGADILQKFDALGRRISRDDGTTTTVFVPSGQQTIADYTAGTAASSPTYRYVYASYIDEPVMRAGSTSTAKLYYHRNQQYSVTALTDTTGSIAERYAYDAYGKLTVTDGSGNSISGSAYGNRYTYTGREWDGELGLYYFRARMYSPESGRFVSRDPIGYEDGQNLYENSFRLVGVDPTGLLVDTVTQAARVCANDHNKRACMETLLGRPLKPDEVAKFFPKQAPPPSPQPRVDVEQAVMVGISLYCIKKALDVIRPRPQNNNDECVEQWESDQRWCSRKYRNDPDNYRACLEWARWQYLACVDDKPRKPFAEPY